MTKKINQNSQYTFKYNKSMGRHGWLRLTPAYSVRLVEEILSHLNYSPRCVMDPFSGTGTTGLVCATRGISSFALEINPFLVWLGNVKLSSYPHSIIKEFLIIAQNLIANIDLFCPSAFPPIYNIHRWWGIQQTEFLAKLKTAISNIKNNEIQQLLKVAFCRIVIELSNAAFNHVSTSFKKADENLFLVEKGKETFLSICKVVAYGASIEPIANSKVLQHDSRSIPSQFLGTYDTVITSPPYPNRISYIRELRPYMYWMDYLKTSEQAGKIDWEIIGGTWGKATSLLASWKSDGSLPPYVYDIAKKISMENNKSATLMANYVLKYLFS